MPNKAKGKKKKQTVKQGKNNPPKQKNKNASLRQGKQLQKNSLPKAARMGHHVATCSILDPFCVHARAIQRPDGGPPTLPIPLKGVFTVSAYSTSAGTKLTVLANPQYCLMEWAKGTGSTWNTPATNLTASPFNNTLVSTYGKEFRITSFGAVVRCIQSATTAKGTVIATVETAQPAFGLTDTAAGSMQGESALYALGANTEFSWVSKPHTNAHMFRPFTQFGQTAAENDWTGLTLEVPFNNDATSGIPILSVEIYMNLEMTLATQSGTASGTTGLAQLVKQPPVPNPVATRAASRVQTSTPSILDGAQAAATDFLSRAAMKAIEDVGEWALALI